MAYKAVTVWENIPLAGAGCKKKGGDDCGKDDGQAAAVL